MKKIRNKTLILVALLALGVLSDATAKQVLLDKVVAVVGGSSVLLSQVEEYAAEIRRQQQSEGYTSERDPKTQALEELMMQKLLYTQAKIDSLEINSAAIAANAQERVQAMQAQAGGLVELEKEFNMEIFNIRETMRRQMEEQSYAQSMRNDIESKVTITPGEVERYYKSHDRDSLPMIGEQYRYAQITRFPSSIDNAKRRVRERLLDMREKIIKGESKFASLARMYSLDPGSAYRGGEMEPQPSTAFVPAFASALEGLKPGQVSEVVESEFGFHIIELIDKKGDLYHCRHILLRPSYTTEELMEPINLLDSVVRVIKADSLTFEQAAMRFSDDASSKMNGGIVTNHDLLERYNAYDAKLTVTKFLKEDFGTRGYKSLDDYMALSRLKEGEISNAFATEDMVGNQLSKVVKLVEVFPAHEATLEEDYLRLEELALAAKKTEEFDIWLNKYIQSTYIYIDPEFRNSEFENPNWIK